jgi:hypothetical protein
MLLLLAFGLALFAAVLLSGLAERTVLSTAVVFLAAGFCYELATGADVRPLVASFAEVALVSVLFSGFPLPSFAGGGACQAARCSSGYRSPSSPRPRSGASSRGCRGARRSSSAPRCRRRTRSSRRRSWGGRRCRRGCAIS